MSEREIVVAVEGPAGTLARPLRAACVVSRLSTLVESERPRIRRTIWFGKPHGERFRNIDGRQCTALDALRFNVAEPTKRIVAREDAPKLA